MALVMTSNYTSGGPPPLPARNTQGHSGVGKKVGRSHSTDAHPQRPPSGGRSPSDPTLPPRPVERGTSDRGIRRKSFETDSFIDRNTARAFSNQQQQNRSAHVTGHTSPREDRPLPPEPPSLKSLPKKTSTSRLQDVYEVEDNPPPPPPSSRPPQNKRSQKRPVPEEPRAPALPPVSSERKLHSQSSTEDLESRFFFHDRSDFPSPDAFSKIRKKYPSRPVSDTKPMGSFMVKEPANLGYL